MQKLLLCSASIVQRHCDTGSQDRVYVSRQLTADPGFQACVMCLLKLHRSIRIYELATVFEMTCYTFYWDPSDSCKLIKIYSRENMKYLKKKITYNRVQNHTHESSTYKLSATPLNCIIPSSFSSTVCIKSLFSQLFYEASPNQLDRSLPSNTHSHNLILHINVFCFKSLVNSLAYFLCFRMISMFVASSFYSFMFPRQVLLPSKIFPKSHHFSAIAVQTSIMSLLDKWTLCLHTCLPSQQPK